MSFYKEIVKIEEELKKMGHEVFIPNTTHKFIESDGYMFNEDMDFCQKHDVLMDHYKKIEKSDASLILNFKKGNIENYIGGSVLGEILISYYLGKKIFLYNNIPDEKVIRYAFEIRLTNPIIIHGDLSKITPSPDGE
jgi:hypothetical protein